MDSTPVAGNLLANGSVADTGGARGGEAGLARVDDTFAGLAGGGKSIGNGGAILSSDLTWEWESTSTAYDVSLGRMFFMARDLQDSRSTVV